MDEKTAIKKGFNAGYWLEKYEPELSKMIQASFGDREHPYAVGFVKGSREFTQEQFMKSAGAPQDQASELDMDDPGKVVSQDKRKDDQDLGK